MAEQIPASAKTLLKTLKASVPAWSVVANHGTGTHDYGGLSEETDGEGKRHRIVETAPVESYLIRAKHVDGRAFVATWLHRQGEVSQKTQKPVWTVDTIWRGKHEAGGEHTPKQITSTELKVYVATPGVAEALAAIEDWNDEQARKRAAKRLGELREKAADRVEQFGEVA